MEPFATVEQYEARYGEVEDRQQVETLLGDASAFIAAQPGFILLGQDDDGYDPYSDRPAEREPLFSEDPWN